MLIAESPAKSKPWPKSRLPRSGLVQSGLSHAEVAALTDGRSTWSIWPPATTPRPICETRRLRPGQGSIT
jgi:hypothetical protein